MSSDSMQGMIMSTAAPAWPLHACWGGRGCNKGHGDQQVHEADLCRDCAHSSSSSPQPPRIYTPVDFIHHQQQGLPEPPLWLMDAVRMPERLQQVSGEPADQVSHQASASSHNMLSLPTPAAGNMTPCSSLCLLYGHHQAQSHRCSQPQWQQHAPVTQKALLQTTRPAARVSPEEPSDQVSHQDPTSTDTASTCTSASMSSNESLPQHPNRGSSFYQLHVTPCRSVCLLQLNREG
jgi:hypothetical protein